MNAKKRRKVYKAAQGLRAKARAKELPSDRRRALRVLAQTIEEILWKDTPMGSDRAAALLETST